MSAEDGWRVVDQDQDDLPTLLLRSKFDKDGYMICLTDLSRIWSEQLTKDALIERAHELGCSIDPGDDTAQYKIFTKKLKSALDQQSGTSLELKSARTGTTIVLSLAVPLPKPLSTLEWEVHLQRNDDLLSSQLTGPLVEHTHTLQQQIVYLLGELQAKDHVLSRLTDRLEASGTPLSDVFPNVANIAGRARAPSKEKLAQHVRGLAVFDPENWEDRVNTQSSESLAYLSEVVRSLPSTINAIAHRSHWWGGLDVKISRSMTLSAESNGMDQSSPPDEGDTTVVFETQLQEQKHGGEKKHDSSTDDDFEDNVASSPPRKSADRDVLETSHKPVKKIGVLGGRRANAKGRSQSPPRDTSPSEPSATPQPEDRPAAKPKSKLGTIGGKKIARAKTPEPQVEPESAESTSIAASPPKPRKLGVLGGKKKDASNGTTMARVTDDDRRPTTKAEPKSSPAEAPAESDVPEEERADHKRDQLKRQLEEQAKAPVKKKRRF